MRVVVTGAHGLTGGAVVRALEQRGHDVAAFVRRSAPVPGSRWIVVGELADREALEIAATNADALVHVAGIQLGERIAAAAPLMRIPRIVVVSSAGIYSRHRRSVSTYERNEAILTGQRPDVTIVRPTMIYGSSRDRNIHHVIAFARRWRFLPIPGQGTALIQPIHYQDLAAALAVLAEEPGPRIIDAGGARPLTLTDAARAVHRALVQPERIIHVHLAVLRLVALVLDRGPRGRWSERVDRATEDRSIDNAGLVAATGVRPRDLLTGLADMLRCDGP